MNIAIGYDATHENLATAEGHLPAGSLFAGYATGSPDIMWTPADWSRHRNALRIDQDPSASDYTADYLDVENGAATPAEASSWYTRAVDRWNTGTRPGQRYPAIYMSASNVTSVVNSLISNGVKSGPGLVVADWNLSEPQAVQDVVDAAGPFPIVGVQFKSTGAYDINVFSGTWVNDVSTATPQVPVPPGQWKDASEWTWHRAALVGLGLDANMWMFDYDPSTNQWYKREL